MKSKSGSQYGVGLTGPPNLSRKKSHDSTAYSSKTNLKRKYTGRTASNMMYQVNKTSTDSAANNSYH